MKYKLEWKYKLKGNEDILFTSDWIDGESALQAGEDIEKSGKGKEIIYYDEAGTSWSTKEMRKLLMEVEEDPHDITVFFDGGFNKETCQAGLGAVIYFKQGKKSTVCGQMSYLMRWIIIMKQNMRPFITLSTCSKKWAFII